MLYLFQADMTSFLVFLFLVSMVLARWGYLQLNLSSKTAIKVGVWLGLFSDFR